MQLHAVTATAVDNHSDDAGMRAYLDLLASAAPLTPASPASASNAELAYLDLLASAAPLTPADLLPRVATTVRPARSFSLTAPALLGERGRHAIVAAALAIGVGVAGLGVGVAAVASPSRADGTVMAEPVRRKAATEQPAADPATDLPGTAAHNAIEEDLAVRDAVTPTEDLLSDAPQRSSAPALRKPKPLPKPKPVVVTVTAAAWVNPLPEASVTSCFGQRWGRLHAGVDLAAPHGTRIRAAGAGVVVAAGEEGGYGNAVLIDHGNGFLTHYGHMSAITVTVGQQVKAAEEIGLEGSTGHSTGPHLHFEVHQGHYKNPIEPTAWMRAHGVDIPGCSETTASADTHDH
ncbi:M23 family metallopeptidase [Actinoplanes sp. NPDC089786]|uniref:M23 family metallopeptidase n=1 Tax=Actinoplanes sp. NPDC089786 TaxID=3155185 RepID=UPI0034343F1C